MGKRLSSNWIWLSHPLENRTPSYGDSGRFIQGSIKSIKQGDYCNTSWWKFPNHLGTHIDLPLHFFENAPSIDNYLPEFWQFRKVAIAHCHIISEGRWIETDDLHRKIPSSVEILLVQTGFERFRGKRQYWEDGPGLSPDIAEWLRKERPSVRVVGMDFISTSRWRDRRKGKKAHLAFLDPNQQGKPIPLIEDMKMEELQPTVTIKHLYVAPLRVCDADGTPCTILAEIQND